MHDRISITHALVFIIFSGCATLESIKKGQSGNPSGLPKNPPSPERRLEEQARREVYREVSNIVVEARKYSGLAVDTLVELTKEGHTDSTRYTAATELLDRGYGRPAQSLDLHLSADAITKRLSDMTDAELAALEAPGDLEHHLFYRCRAPLRFYTGPVKRGARCAIRL
jgi:hypothetical protein